MPLFFLRRFYLFSDAECAEALPGVRIQMFLGLFSDVTVDLLFSTCKQKSQKSNINLSRPQSGYTTLQIDLESTTFRPFRFYLSAFQPDP